MIVMKTKQVTVRLPMDLWLRAKAAAAESERPLQDLMVEGLKLIIGRNINKRGVK